MRKRPGSGWAAVAIVLTAWAGVAARGADDSPKKAPEGAPKSAVEVPESAVEAPKSGAEALDTPKSPEETLSARGLTRSGTRFILKKQEDECFNKFDEIRPLYEKLESSYNKLVAIAMGDAQVAEIQGEQAWIQQQLQLLSTSGNSMSRYSGRYGGRYARYAQSPAAQVQQQLRAQQTVLSQQLALAKQQAVPAKDKQEANALYGRHRTALLASSAEVRELFEKVQKEYTDVEAEPPVRTALGALRQSAKAQLKIAPSTEFTKKLAQLKNLEKMLRPESIAPAPSTKSKSKRSVKSKR